MESKPITSMGGVYIGENVFAVKRKTNKGEELILLYQESHPHMYLYISPDMWKKLVEVVDKES